MRLEDPLPKAFLEAIAGTGRADEWLIKEAKSANASGPQYEWPTLRFDQ